MSLNATAGKNALFFTIGFLIMGLNFKTLAIMVVMVSHSQIKS